MRGQYKFILNSKLGQVMSTDTIIKLNDKKYTLKKFVHPMSARDQSNYIRAASRRVVGEIANSTVTLWTFDFLNDRVSLKLPHKEPSSTLWFIDTKYKAVGYFNLWGDNIDWSLLLPSLTKCIDITRPGYLLSPLRAKDNWGWVIWKKVS